MVSEHRTWLQARTNKHHRPFQPDTVSAYIETRGALDRWTSEQGIEGDFTGCDTVTLNKFFAAHSQGGANTRQLTEQPGHHGE